MKKSLNKSKLMCVDSSNKIIKKKRPKINFTTVSASEIASNRRIGFKYLF